MLIIPFSLYGQTQTDLLEYVKNKWPGDYKMQEYELQKFAESIAELNELLDSQGGVKDELEWAQLVQVALSKWELDESEKVGGVEYDYPMLLLEIKSQVESYMNIKKLE